MVVITEQTLDEIVAAVEKAKYDTNSHLVCSAVVKSEHSDVSFSVNLGQSESLAYRLKPPVYRAWTIK